MNIKPNDSMTLCIATKNAGKAREFHDLLGGRFKVITLLDIPDIPDIPEDGDTFQANAIQKAQAVSALRPGVWVVADDSGLEVDALNGAPGVRSARYAGEPKSDSRNLQKLLEALHGVPESKRTARFRCVLAIVRDGKVETLCEGACEGSIIEEARGQEGFGYDPIFVPLGHRETFAQMSLSTKQDLSHRGKALVVLKAFFN